MCVCLLAMTVQGCATLQQTGTASENKSASAATQDVIYTVKPGDSLSDIAGRLTGDVGNWQSIADYNNITDPRKLVPGDELRIPSSLLLQVYNINDRSIPGDNQRSDSVVAASASTATSGTPAIGTTMAVQRASDSDLISAQPVKLHPVSVNRSFELIPFDRQSATNSRSVSFASSAPAVRVIGTYFPKGVYEGPANYSRLIMRVSPGTVFELDSEVNDWYKVITDKGVGYVRAADAVLVAGKSS